MAQYSPLGVGLRDSELDEKIPVSPSREVVINRRSMRLSREKPWETSPVPFWQLPTWGRPKELKSKSPTKKKVRDEEPPATESRPQWDSHHHITWSNHQNLQGEVLNPPPTRNYFDRPRDPEIGARSAERRPPTTDGDGSPGKKVVRVIPVWRLEPTPGNSDVPEVGTLCPREPSLKSKTGSGGKLENRDDVLGPKHPAHSEYSHKSTWPCPSTLTQSKQAKSELEKKQGST
jgi:hypothetical protein